MTTTNAGIPVGPSLYEQLGGAAVITAAVDHLCRGMLGDPELAPFFLGIDMGQQRHRMEKFLTTVLGGPAVYEGPSMRRVHQHLRVEGRHFDLVVGYLKATLEARGVAPALVAQTIAAVAPLRHEIVAAAWA
jgi:hemoglobin